MTSIARFNARDRRRGQGGRRPLRDGLPVNVWRLPTSQRSPVSTSDHRGAFAPLQARVEQLEGFAPVWAFVSTRPVLPRLLRVVGRVRSEIFQGHVLLDIFPKLWGGGGFDNASGSCRPLAGSDVYCGETPRLSATPPAR